VRRLLRAVADLVGGGVLWIPGGIGSRLRIVYYRGRGATIGRGVRIDAGVMVDQPDRLEIGDDAWIDRFAVLICGLPRAGRETRAVGPERPDLVGRIRIGDRCHIGPHTVISGLGGVEIGDDVTLSAGVKVYSLSHHYRSWSRPADETVVFGSRAPDERQSMLQGPVLVGRNCGVAVDSLLLPGAVVAERSFVRPHSVVSGSWPPNSILSGSPAEREGPRFDTAVTDA
jgi:acetyltransferase-like isoleucine patch superfamily enzyme